MSKYIARDEDGKYCEHHREMEMHSGKFMDKHGKREGEKKISYSLHKFINKSRWIASPKYKIFKEKFLNRELKEGEQIKIEGSECEFII